MKTRSIPLRSVPIKVRLTAWYFVVMAVVMSALGALALAGMEHSIRSTVDEQLADRVKVINKLLQDFRPRSHPPNWPPHSRKPRAKWSRGTHPNLR